MPYDIYFTDTAGNRVGEVHTTDDMTQIAGLMYTAQVHSDTTGVDLQAHFQPHEHVIKITPRKRTVRHLRTSNGAYQPPTPPNACDIQTGG